MTGAVYRIIFILLICFTAASAYADTEHAVTVNAAVNKPTAAIGDRIEYTITVNAPDDYEVELPSFGENLADFSVKDFKSDESGFFSRTYTQTYTLDIYETGTFTIPAAVIKYRENSTAEWMELITQELSVTVRSMLDESGPAAGIREIKGPYSLKSFMYLYITLAVIAVIIGALILYIYLRRRRKEKEIIIPPPPAHETALKALRELMEKDYIRKGNIKEYYVELSTIVRHYLEDRFSMHAPEMTTEEFLVLLRDTDKLNAEQKELLRQFLSHCDMVKFAKHLPQEKEIESSYEHAERLIEQTKETVIRGAA